MPHGGDLVAEILRKHGVTQVFGQPGGQTAAFYQGLANRKDMSHLGCRDESRDLHLRGRERLPCHGLGRVHGPRCVQ